MVPEGYNLDELLEERTLTVNNVKFNFISVHLLVEDEDTIGSSSSCEVVNFARLIVEISDSAAVDKEVIKASFPEKIREAVKRVDVYRLRNIAVVYFDAGKVSDVTSLMLSRELEVGERRVGVKRVCMLQDIQPSSSDNELRLSRFKVICQIQAP